MEKNTGAKFCQKFSFSSQEVNVVAKRLAGWLINFFFFFESKNCIGITMDIFNVLDVEKKLKAIECKGGEYTHDLSINFVNGRCFILCKRFFFFCSKYKEKNLFINSTGQIII